jgi:hypothetical protein
MLSPSRRNSEFPAGWTDSHGIAMSTRPRVEMRVKRGALSGACHPRSRWRKKASDLRAPLRNRTVDLLLTISRRRVFPTWAHALNWKYAGTHWQRQALISAARRHPAPQSAPQCLRLTGPTERIRAAPAAEDSEVRLERGSCRVSRDVASRSGQLRIAGAKRIVIRSCSNPSGDRRI